MAKNVLKEIKDDLDAFVGQRVSRRANKGRRKIIQKDGVLEKTYPHIFVVKVEEGQSPRRLSYSYADILTETVEIKIKEDDTKIGCLNL
ncbi:MAG: Veg family protein [Halanaerobium sp.]|nr:Veg family protein [Halanaerobium sp.]